jgi:hypothetical protein
MQLLLAKKGNLAAGLVSVGELHELYDFYVSPRKYIPGSGAKRYKAGVTRGTSKVLEHNPKPFVIKFRSGHETLAERNPSEKMKSNSKKDKIEKLLSPAIPHMVFSESQRDVARELIAKTYAERLAYYIQKEIDRGNARLTGGG